MIKTWDTQTTRDYVDTIEQFEAFDDITRAELKLQDHMLYKEYVHAKLVLTQTHILHNELNTHNNIGDTHCTAK